MSSCGMNSLICLPLIIIKHILKISVFHLKTKSVNLKKGIFSLKSCKDRYGVRHKVIVLDYSIIMKPINQNINGRKVQMLYYSMPVMHPLPKATAINSLKTLKAGTNC